MNRDSKSGKLLTFSIGERVKHRSDSGRHGVVTEVDDIRKQNLVAWDDGPQMWHGCIFLAPESQGFIHKQRWQIDRINEKAPGVPRGERKPIRPMNDTSATK